MSKAVLVQGKLLRRDTLPGEDRREVTIKVECHRGRTFESGEEVEASVVARRPCGFMLSLEDWSGKLCFRLEKRLST